VGSQGLKGRDCNNPHIAVLGVFHTGQLIPFDKLAEAPNISLQSETIEGRLSVVAVSDAD
jgi:hypothetical protein